MDTLTHALAPVILVKICTRRTEDAGWRVLLPIAGAGALPDLLNPHLSLEARVASWSHGLPCWALVTMIFLLGSMLMSRHFRPRTAVACSAAYLFHLVCDAISGGINWLSPFGTFQWGESLAVDPARCPMRAGVLLSFPPRSGLEKAEGAARMKVRPLPVRRDFTIR
ncbi:MAG: metal-dependent hydrolase [Akkermansiaceae bacterium]|nr:metal-dependent hydrolase [Akkermansiaceae bacterium]